MLHELLLRALHCHLYMCGEMENMREICKNTPSCFSAAVYLFAGVSNILIRMQIFRTMCTYTYADSAQFFCYSSQQYIVVSL